MNDNAQPAARARKPWPAVFSIAVSSFSLVSAEFLPVGLLNAMAADPHLHPSARRACWWRRPACWRKYRRPPDHPGGQRDRRQGCSRSACC